MQSSGWFQAAGSNFKIARYRPDSGQSYPIRRFASTRAIKILTDWAGKAERQQISVPALPLFVKESHSTGAILETLKSYKADGTQMDYFGEPQLDIADKLDACQHKGPWSNRLVLICVYLILLFGVLYWFRPRSASFRPVPPDSFPAWSVIPRGCSYDMM